MRLCRRDRGRFQAYCFETLGEDWKQLEGKEHRYKCIVCSGTATWFLVPLGEGYCYQHKSIARLVWLSPEHELCQKADRKEWKQGQRSKKQRVVEAEAEIVALGEASQEQILEVLGRYSLTLAEWMHGRKRLVGQEPKVKVKAMDKLAVPDLSLTQLEQRLIARKAEESYYLEAAAWEVLEGRNLVEVALEFEVDEVSLTAKVEELRQKGKEEGCDESSDCD